MHNNNPQETRGWEIVRQLNDGVPTIGALNARQLLAEYFKLNCYRPSRLHSAILSCATKMAMAFPDFHFVPFLEMWGLENLRSDDSESRTDETGKRFPSLVERMTKAYAYSLLFHPQQHLDGKMETMLMPLLQKKGYSVRMVDGQMVIASAAIATRVFVSDVRNRKMTFVQLLLPDGEELVTEVHTMTAFCRMRYEDMVNKMFDVLLRSSENGKLRVEAAIPSSGSVAAVFPVEVGYVDHVDGNHMHIHVFDNQSRHLVSKFVTTNIEAGQYVEFVPVIPSVGSFKTAVITRVLENGPEMFGYRDVVVTYVNAEQGYCSWELLPATDGKVVPIMETGAAADVEPATKGYISRHLFESKGIPMPKKGDKLKIVTFLKRGKDKKKRPVVVEVFQTK